MLDLHQEQEPQEAGRGCLSLWPCWQQPRSPHQTSPRLARGCSCKPSLESVSLALSMIHLNKLFSSQLCSFHCLPPSSEGEKEGGNPDRGISVCKNGGVKETGNRQGSSELTQRQRCMSKDQITALYSAESLTQPPPPSVTMDKLLLLYRFQSSRKQYLSHAPSPEQFPL